jgi:outer membrane receptor protein involved in Fe transport
MKRSPNKLYQFVAAACLPITLTAQAQLEEVIVTAQKRAESLQDVPISISTVSGEKIQDNTILNFAALADFVPSLHIADASVNTNIYMRGIGSGNNRGFEQSVGMYVDGVYLGRGRQYRSGLMDIERIEVLRGPQGTLFGKNTVAGAINITSASPVVGDDTSGEINVSIEENGGSIAEGFLQGGSETFAARIALRGRETDGYVYNAFLEQDEGGIDEFGGRITLVWEPSDVFSANFKYSYMERERDGSNSATWRFLSPAERDVQVPKRSAFASTAYTMMDVFFPDFSTIAGKDFTTYKDNNYGQSKDDGIGIGLRPDSSEDEIENMSLSLTWELGGGTLTSVTGFAGYEYFDDVDVDWLPLQFIDRSDQHDFEQYSQELRWASDIGDRFSYTVGGYVDKNELDARGQVVIDTNFDGLFPLFAALGAGLPAEAVPLMPQSLLGPLTADSPLNGIPGYGVYAAEQVSRNHNFTQDTESWAVFAQGTYDLTDALRVTVGVRYTEEEKDAVSDQKLGDSFCGITGNLEGGSQGQCAAYNNWLAVVQAANFNSYNKYWTGSRKTDDLSPSVNLQWDMSDSSMLYVNWSEGFKSGGFSAADDGNPGDLPVGVPPIPPAVDNGFQANGYVSAVPNEDFEFEDESVDSIEIGGKHEFMDGRMRLNWAAFYSEYDNLQTTIFKGVGFSVKNAASSEVEGLEVDWLFQMTDAIRVGINAAYLDASYGDFKDGPCDAIQLDADRACGTPAGTTSNDLTGYRTLYASEWSGNAFIDVRFPMGNMEWFGGVDVNYRDEFDSAGDADPYDVIDAYTKVNARIGLSAERWEIMAYGRNIFDEVAYQQSFDTPVLAGSHTFFMEEGAVFGIRGTLRF